MQTPHPDASIPTPTGGPTVVAVLYEHSLLGEGLARLLAREPGLQVTSVRTGDALASAAPFDPVPDVVILERSDPDHAFDVLRFAPDALVIEVGLEPGPTVTYHRSEISTRPEVLLRAIREVRRQGGRAGAAVESGAS